MFETEILGKENPLDLPEENLENSFDPAVLEIGEDGGIALPLDISIPWEDKEVLITILGLSEDEREIYLSINMDSFAEQTAEMTTEMTTEWTTEMHAEGTTEMAPIA